ncbi:hypothetical protein HDU76_008521 [Blyttiomyces sp. JEL0837]|nr:hypothetical protein HDU76_008521 [Blyttiomyces sp. JEL0837]
MQLFNIVAAALALASATVMAKPLDTVAEVKIKGVRYMDHVKFADNVALERRGGGGSTTTTTTSTTAGATTATSTTSSATAAYTTYSGKLVYYGGPVIPTINVIPLWWGSSVSYTSQLPAFYGGIVNSTYWDMLKQYSTSSSSVIQRGTVGTPITLTGYPTATSIDDTNDIVPYLRSLVSAGTISPTANT